MDVSSPIKTLFLSKQKPFLKMVATIGQAPTNFHSEYHKNHYVSLTPTAVTNYKLQLQIFLWLLTVLCLRRSVSCSI